MRVRTCLIVAAALVAAFSGRGAELVYNFTTGVDGFVSGSWSSTGPAGWSGGAALQATNNAGGWTMGNGGGPMKDLTAEPGALDLIASGAARLSFDVIVDGSSFKPATPGWFQVWIAGNSGGTAGWTQKMVVDSYHNADDATMVSTHVDVPYADVGWQAGDTWYQLWLGANSDGAAPVNFYVDNVRLQVPEPSSAMLLILGVVGLFIRNRSGR